MSQKINTVKKIGILVTLIFVFSGVNAQNFAIKWGLFERQNGSIINVYPASATDFYTLRYVGTAGIGNYKLTANRGLETILKTKIAMKVETGMASLEDVVVVQGRIFAFLSNKREKIRHLFLQEYSRNLEPVGTSIELTSYEYDRAFNKGDFKVIVSKNQSYFAVIYDIPGKLQQEDRYGFRVYDLNLTVMSKGDFQLPFSPKLSVVNEHHLTNTGEYFVAVTEYSTYNNLDFIKSFNSYKALHVYHVSEDKLDDFIIELDGKRVESVKLNSNDDRVFSATGLYGDRLISGAQGAFFMRIDYENKQIKDQGFQPFGVDILVEGESKMASKSTRFMANRMNLSPAAVNYMLRDITLLADGSIVGSMEEYYTQVSQTVDKYGNTTTTTTYNYDDIILFKISALGTFDWLKKVRKKQSSINDFGKYSSYAEFLMGDKLYLLFNDNKNNYDDSKSFIKDRKYLSNASFRGKRNVLACAEIDLSTGEITRKVYADYKQLKSTLIPKMTQLNTLSGDIILYAVQKRKERFGKITLND